MMNVCYECQGQGDIIVNISKGIVDKCPTCKGKGEIKDIKIGEKVELKRFIGKYEVTQVTEKGVWARGGRCGVSFYPWSEIEI
jgi:DnaJ-class molecular chaperone